MITPAGTKRLAFGNRQKESILFFFIVVISVLIQADICQATIVEEWSWQDEPLLRWGWWYESFGGDEPGMSGYGPLVGYGEFLWSFSGLVPEEGETTSSSFGNWLITTTKRTGGTFKLSDDLCGSAMIFNIETATVTEWISPWTGRVVWSMISLHGMSNDGISLDFDAALRSWFDWPSSYFGRVRRVRIAIAPEPSTALILGILAALCLPYGRFVNRGPRLGS